MTKKKAVSKPIKTRSSKATGSIKTKAAVAAPAAKKAPKAAPKTASNKPRQAAQKPAQKQKPAPKKMASLKKISPAAPAPAVASKPKKKLSPREEKLFQIKLLLLRQRALLLSGAESALNELPGQTLYPDLGDQATAETDRNFMLRLRGREQRLLKKIDEAVERIEAGTFGICDDCGCEIGIKRLEARPVTTMCVECKTIQEEEEKLREN
ncbi:MAG: TraR/DksA family transcriptional regulator [Thermodesulfovibrionales bacterium]